MIALKLDEVLRRLRNELSKVPGARLIMVFGSVARGDYRPDSDVDVMLVADDVGKARRAAREVSSTIFADTGVPVTVIVVSPEEYLGGKYLPYKENSRFGRPKGVHCIDEKAESKLEAARVLLNEGKLEDAVSRAYYAAYNAAKAIFLLGEEASTMEGWAFKLWTRLMEPGLLERIRQDT